MPFEHFTIIAITGTTAITAVTIFGAYIGLGPVFSILAATTLGLMMWDLLIGTFDD